MCWIENFEIYKSGWYLGEKEGILKKILDQNDKKAPEFFLDFVDNTHKQCYAEFHPNFFVLYFMASSLACFSLIKRRPTQ